MSKIVSEIPCGNKNVNKKIADSLHFYGSKKGRFGYDQVSISTRLVRSSQSRGQECDLVLEQSQMRTPRVEPRSSDIFAFKL